MKKIPFILLAISFFLLSCEKAEPKSAQVNSLKTPHTSPDHLLLMNQLADSVTWVPFKFLLPNSPAPAGSPTGPNLGYIYTGRDHQGLSQLIHLKKNIEQKEVYCFQYTLNKGDFFSYAYVGWGQEFPTNYSQFKHKFQWLSYTYKGAAHVYIPRLSSVKDYKHYQLSVPKSTEWTQTTLTLKNAKQSTQAIKVKWDTHLLESMDWLIQGSDGQLDDLCISDVKLGYIK